jgi:hypothetical protein
MTIRRLIRLGALAPFLLPAQSDRGVISGVIRDSSGAAVPDAKISASNVETNVVFRTVSNDAGNFTIPALSVGTYRLAVEREGFKSFVRSDILVAAGSDLRVDATLEVGAVSESVQVSGAAEQLQTANANVTSEVSNRLVDDLPLVVGGAMRSAFDLALITPEARQDASAPVGSDNAFALGGGQVAAYGITLDGISANIARYNTDSLISVNTPSLDAITEFTVATNGFKAEYGRASGGVMTFTSKSGTNNLHGTAYEFLRNDALDARSFFDVKRQIYKQHDFGFSVGGPVFLPKLYNGRNRTFFFVGGEWFRNSVGTTNQYLSVPTPEMYQGDFHNWVDATGKALAIYDPSTTRLSGGSFVRDPFPGNIIPRAGFSPFVQTFLKQIGQIAYPNTNARPGTSDYVRNNYIDLTGSTRSPWSKISTKIDHNISTNDRLGVLYYDGSYKSLAGPDGFPGLPSLINPTEYNIFTTHVVRATYTKVIRPTIVNSFYGGYNGLASDKAVLSAVHGYKAKGVCMPGVIDCDQTLPTIQFSDYPTWGGSAGDGAENYLYSAGDDLTVTHGRHTLKFGFLWERLDFNGFGRQSISGLINGDRRMTSIPGNNNLSSGGGNGFASLLLGQAYSGGTETNRYVVSEWRSYAWYAQDDFRVSSRLTVNFGLRYEFTLPPIETEDRIADFTPSRPNPGAGGIPGALRFGGAGPGREGSRALVPGWYGGFGPRLGFAYKLNDRTVLRAAGSRGFGVVKTVSGSSHYDGFSVIFRPTSTDGGITPAFLVDQGVPAFKLPPLIDPAFSNGNNVAYWNNEAVRLPEEYDWTFTLQRQLTPATTLEAGYNATVGAHLEAGLLNLNQLPFSDFQQYGLSLLQSGVTSAAAGAAGIRIPYPGFTGSVAQALRPYPQYLTVDTATGNGDKSGHSSYHAMILKLQRRFSRGFALQTSYVLSKILTDADTYQVTGIYSLDQYNRRLDKSIGGYDQTHNFKVSYVWELPFGRGKRLLSSGLASRLAGGWRFSGIQTVQSGLPLSLTNNNTYNIFNGRNPATVSTYNGWETHVSNPNWFGSDRFFQSPSYFGPQPANQLGNATRYNPKARTRPAFGNNISLAKSIALREPMHIDFRAEAFNLFNAPRFGTGSTNLSDPNFGVVRTQINPPRQLQLALKLYF